MTTIRRALKCSGVPDSEVTLTGPMLEKAQASLSEEESRIINRLANQLSPPIKNMGEVTAKEVLAAIGILADEDEGEDRECLMDMLSDLERYYERDGIDTKEVNKAKVKVRNGH